MAEIKMGVVESHFADIIWANEPLHSRELVKLCEKELNDFYAVQSEQFVDEAFEGSLPAFIAAFTHRKGISQEEAAQIRRMIDAAAGKV